MASPLPAFSSLPLRKGDPPRSAWGRWGAGDQLGTLNYLSDELVLKTMRNEIRTGRRVGLNLPLDLINPPFLGRIAFEKKIINKAPRIINDDVISLNTQSSSQWDSFRHFAFQKEAQFYEGATQKEIHGSGSDYSNGVNVLDAWAEKGIAGRGVLVDYLDYAERNGIVYEKTKTHQITAEAVKTILAETNTKIETGDILFIRTGFVRGYLDLDQTARCDEDGKTMARTRAFARDSRMAMGEPVRCRGCRQSGKPTHQSDLANNVRNSTRSYSDSAGHRSPECFTNPTHDTHP